MPKTLKAKDGIGTKYQLTQFSPKEPWILDYITIGGFAIYEGEFSTLSKAYHYIKEEQKKIENGTGE